MSDDKRLYADGGSGSLGSNSAANDASAGSVPARPRTGFGPGVSRAAGHNGIYRAREPRPRASCWVPLPLVARPALPAPPAHREAVSRPSSRGQNAAGAAQHASRTQHPAYRHRGYPAHERRRSAHPAGYGLSHGRRGNRAHIPSRLVAGFLRGCKRG